MVKREMKSVMNPNSKKPWQFAIDFDNTLSLEEYPTVGDPVPGAIETVKELEEKGYSVYLWTNRTGVALLRAIVWAKNQGLKLRGANFESDPNLVDFENISPKMFADYYIDDKNLGCPRKTFESNGKVYKIVDWERLREILVAEGFLE